MPLSVNNHSANSALSKEPLRRSRKTAVSPSALGSWVLFFLFPAVLACSSPPKIQFAEKYRPDAEKIIKGVPFFPQQTLQCGPASMAGVLNYYGRKLEPEEIREYIFRKNLGTVTIDMVLFARKIGFDAAWFSGKPDDIIAAVDSDTPLIVMVDLGFAGVSRMHYMVVVGYKNEKVVVNSGGTPHKEIPWDVFLKTWAGADNWVLRINPKAA